MNTSIENLPVGGSTALTESEDMVFRGASIESIKGQDFNKSFFVEAGKDKSILLPSFNNVVSLSFRLLGAPKGSEVIVSPFTPSEELKSLVGFGFIPVVIDCQENGLGFSAEAFLSAVSFRTFGVLFWDAFGLMEIAPEIRDHCANLQIKTVGVFGNNKTSKVVVNQKSAWLDLLLLNGSGVVEAVFSDERLSSLSVVEAFRTSDLELQTREVVYNNSEDRTGLQKLEVRLIQQVWRLSDREHVNYSGVDFLLRFLRLNEKYFLSDSVFTEEAVMLELNPSSGLVRLEVEEFLLQNGVSSFAFARKEFAGFPKRALADIGVKVLGEFANSERIFRHVLVLPGDFLRDFFSAEKLIVVLEKFTQSKKAKERPPVFVREETGLPDITVMVPNVFADLRGSAFEVLRLSEVARFGGSSQVAQVFSSISKRGVLRGLHYQLPPYSQTKVVWVVEGEIFDVLVDMRESSPTFGKHTSVLLSAENKKVVVIPDGFAHGFLVLSETARVCYTMSQYYSPELSRGVIWNDPTLAIQWPVVPEIILSEQDKGWGDFEKADRFV